MKNGSKVGSISVELDSILELKGTVKLIDVSIDMSMNEIFNESSNVIFYDAIETGISSFSLNTNSEVEEPSALASAAPIDYNQIIKNFSIELHNININIQLNETEEEDNLVFVIPYCEMYCPSGTSDFFIDLGMGCSLKWILSDETVELAITNNPISIIANAFSHEIQIKLMRESRIYLPERILDTLTSLLLQQQQSKVGNSSSFHWSINLSISALTLALFNKYEIECHDIFVSINEGTYSVLIKGCNTCQELNPLLSFNDFHFESSVSSMKCSIGKILLQGSIEQPLLDLLQLPNWLNTNIRLMKSSTSERPFNMEIKLVELDSIEVSSLLGRISGSLDEVEVRKSNGQLSLHVKSMRAVNTNSQSPSTFNFALTKFSVFFMKKNGALESLYNSPFTTIKKLIEGIPFTSTITSTEDYFLIRSRLIEECSHYWHLSAETLTLESSLSFIELKDMLDVFTTGSFSQSIVDSPNITRENKCLTGTIGIITIKLTKYELLMESIATDFYLNTKNNIGNWLDIRAESFGVKLDYLNESLVGRVLTTSLDPHFRSFILTVSLNDNMETILGIFATGYLIHVPLHNEKFQSTVSDLFEVVKQHQSDTLSGEEEASAFQIFLQFHRCALRPVFNSVLEHRIPPHAIYVEEVRIVKDNLSKNILVFVQKSEIMCARSVEWIRTVDGLFDEGHNYWLERNFESLIQMDFLSLEMPIEGRNILKIEDNMISVTLHNDSLVTLKTIISEYVDHLRLQRLSELSEVAVQASDAVDEESKVFFTSPSSTFQFDLEEEEIDYNAWNQAAAAEQAVEDVNPYSFPILTEVDYKVKVTEEVEEERTVNLVNEEQEIRMKVYENIDFEENFFNPKPYIQEQSQTPLYNNSSSGSALPAPSNNQFTLWLKDFSVKIRLFAGRHWNAQREGIVGGCSEQQTQRGTDSIESGSLFGSSPLCRGSSSYGGGSRSSQGSTRWSNILPTSNNNHHLPDHIEILLEGIDLNAGWTNPFPLNLANAPNSILSLLTVAVKNVEIADRVKKSNWDVLLRRKNESEVNTLIQLQMKANYVEGLRQDNDPLTKGLLPEDCLEYKIDCMVEPLKLFLDQETVMLLIDFFKPLTIPNNEDNPSTLPAAAPLFISSLSVSDICLSANYKPKRVKLGKAIAGHYIELLNMFELEDATLRFPSVNLRGLEGVEGVARELCRIWLPHIRNTQVGPMLEGIPAIRSIKNISNGVIDLFLLPIEEYKRQGKVVEGLRKGASSFLHNTALESARLGGSLSLGTHNLLQQAQNLLSNSSSTMDGDAMGMLRSTLSATRHTIIAVPMRVWEDEGSGAAAREVLRAIPVVVLRGAVGGTAALGHVLKDLQRNLEK